MNRLLSARCSRTYDFSSARPLCAALALLLAALFNCSPALARSEESAATQPVSGADFAAAIALLQSRIRALGKDPGAAQTLADSLPKEWVVGERQTHVSAESLRDLAEEYSQDPSRESGLRARLEAQATELADLAAVLSGPPGNAPPDPAAERAHLSQILARPDFHSAMQGSSWALWKARALHWLYRKLDALFRRIPARNMNTDWLPWMLLAALVSVIAVRLYRYFQRHGIATATVSEAPPPGMSWNDWFRSATGAAQAGRYREAIHALYWAAVYRLEELHFWSLDRARTPREYLRIAAGRAIAPSSGTLRPQLAQDQRRALEGLTRGFELTWYGYRQASPSDYQKALTEAEVFGCRPS